MFYGEKLQELRELNGYSRIELAELIGITEQSIWQYENGYSTPKFEIINKLKEIFFVQSKFFFEKSFIEKKANIEKIAYRSTDRESRKKSKAEVTYVDFVDSFIFFFERNVTNNNRRIFDVLNDVEDKTMISPVKTEKEIENIADMARQKLNIKSNENLLYDLELSGIYILEKNVGSSIDAYSTWINDRPLIILGTEKKSAVRRNFDLAHELGHLLMHHKQDMFSADKKENKKLEKEANLFASFFLLPEKEFIEDFSKIKGKSNPKNYSELKLKYFVSIAALEYRAYKLNMITFEENRYFYGVLNREKYKKQEPFDDEIPMIKPGKLRALITFVLDNKLENFNDILNKYSVNEKFISKLLGINNSIFENYKTEKNETFYGKQNKIIELFGN